jgi:hypothetical protein
MDSCLSAHQAGIKKFVDDIKDAVSDIQPEIESAINDETFDFAHYKEQLQKLVDKHNMKDYRGKSRAFMDKHK